MVPKEERISSRLRCAYHMYVKQNHRKYVAFAKLKPEDQQAYWDWRHEHSDAVLKIDVK